MLGEVAGDGRGNGGAARRGGPLLPAFGFDRVDTARYLLQALTSALASVGDVGKLG